MRNAKFILLAAIAIVVFASASFAQTEKQIAAIRAEVQAINKGAAKYTKKTKNLYDLSTEGAEVTYYTSGKDLKKIVAKIYGESGNKTNEYFYQGEDLIFVFEKLNHYDNPIGAATSPKVVRVEETRAYFEGGKCIRLLNGKKTIKADTVEFDEQIYEIVETADTIKGGFDW